MKRDYPEHPLIGVGAVIVEAGRALLVRRDTEPLRGEWSVPGGMLELGEKLRDGVRREVEEETGLRLGALELLSVCDMIDREAGYHWVAPGYLALSFEGEPAIREPTKHSGLGWFDLAALPTPLTAPTVAALAALSTRLLAK